METHRVLPLTTAAEAAQTIQALAHEGDFILIKGSRRLRLETIVEGFRSDVAAPV
jgi:UDP-N-acetylmuramyl pentapeptide synthase